MQYIPNDEMLYNGFIDVSLPTKKQIFGRTGQHAVSPAGSYTGDEVARFGATPTEQAEAFVRAAEAYEPPTTEVKDEPSNKEKK